MKTLVCYEQLDWITIAKIQITIIVLLLGILAWLVILIATLQAMKR